MRVAFIGAAVAPVSIAGAAAAQGRVPDKDFLQADRCAGGVRRAGTSAGAEFKGDNR